MRHLYWWRVVAEHGYVRHAEKRAGNGIDFGCAGAGDGGGYRHGRDQGYISVVLLLGELGVDGAQEFVNTSAQAWDSTLIFLAGLMLLCLQISCGFAVMRGRNWGRWGYVVCQCIVVLYLLLATIGSVFPEVFTVEGETSGQILHVLILQKIPDVVIPALLFVPTASRRFFAARK